MNNHENDATAFARFLKREWMQVTLERLEQMLHDDDASTGVALEVKALTLAEWKQVDVASGTVSGYAATFAVDLGNDEILRGAFAKTIADASVFARAHASQCLWPVLWQHDRSEPIGYISTAREDSKGLLCVFHIDPTIERGRQALRGLASGALSFSVGYRPVQIGWRGSTRLLKEIKLHEVSVVSFPMNLEARAIPGNQDGGAR